MKILSIETSCDETAISILEAEGDFGDVTPNLKKSSTNFSKFWLQLWKKFSSYLDNFHIFSYVSHKIFGNYPKDFSKNGVENPVKFKILANNLISQIEIHKEYGGVFPALAKREHSKNLIPILRKTLSESNLSHRSPTPVNQKGNEIKKILEREPELLKLFMEYIPTIEIPDIEAIAVTQGPGLEPALWVGINFAKALSLVWDKPLIPVNHMEGHLLASLAIKNEKLKIKNSGGKINFPAIGLLISGGHTELIYMSKFRSYEKIGQTRDDAVGEAFDKVARMMDIPYPGGPEISKLAQTQREKICRGATPTSVGVAPLQSDIVLPRPMLNTDDFDFSFSGLKTAVLYLIKNLKKELNKKSLDRHANAREDERDSASSVTIAKQSSLQGTKQSSEIKLPQEIKQEIALEFETAVVEILLKKTEKAIEKYGAKTLIIGGGVSANSQIRQSFQSLGNRVSKLEVLMPEKEFSTDNAVMIGIAGYFEYIEQKKQGQLQTAIDLGELRADGNLKL